MRLTIFGSGRRRITPGIVAAAVLFVALPGLAQEKLVVQSWGGVTLEQLNKNVVAPFQKETGIQVEVRIQENTFDGLTKLRAQKASPVIDVWNTSAVPAMIALDEGLDIPLDKAAISNSQYVPDNLFAPSCVAWEQYIFGLMYDKDAVPFKITKWMDLWDPRLKGKLAVPNPANAEGKFVVLLTWLSGADEAHSDGAFELAKKLKPNVASYYQAGSDRNRILATGEAAVGAFGLVPEYLGLAKGNPQFLFVAPEPFVPVDANCLALVKSGKNTAAANRFINFALSKEIQEVEAASKIVLPVNRTAAIPAALKDYTPDASKFRYPDSAVVKEALPNWIERWNQEIQVQ
jgi:putative spermidine/putrescine transport system substrate-binding protein